MNRISLEDRMRGAIWGQFIGNAAASLDQPGTQTLEFTHYGAADDVMLQSVAACHGFSPMDFGLRFMEKFGSPDYKGDLDHATRETIDNYRLFCEAYRDETFNFQEGADDDGLGTAAMLAPVLVAHLDDPNALAVVESATRVTQNNERAVAYMRFHARIMRSLFQGEDLYAIFENETVANPQDTSLESTIRQKIQEAMVLLPFEVTATTFKLGQGNSLNESFPSSVHAALKHRNSFQDAILATFHAGGDGVGRASLVGTWLGAFLSIRNIPQAWRKRLKNDAEIEHEVESIIKTQLAPLHRASTLPNLVSKND
jgi:ADP-ribosyl-[dinitrogen reductase] hydrolase